MCKYCEGDNLLRSDIMLDYNFNPVCIWDTTLLIDNGKEDCSEDINFCPMCGRKLLESESDINE